MELMDWHENQAQYCVNRDYIIQIVIFDFYVPISIVKGGI